MLDPKAQVASLLSKCYLGEKLIELSRLTLCEKFDFSPSSFFSVISAGPSISARDLKRFLTSKSVQVSDNEVYMIIKQYSCLQDARISREDFLQMFLPSTAEELRERCLSRPLIDSCSDYTWACFLRVLQEELKLQRELEAAKLSLYQQEGFSVFSAFEAIARGRQLIDETDLLQYMREYRFFLSAEDVDALLRRVDLEDDGGISYNEFLEFLVPFDLPAVKTDRMEEGKTDEQETLELNCEKAEKEESGVIGELLFELLLAARMEELKKQELAMYGELTVEGICAVIKIEEVVGKEGKKEELGKAFAPQSKDYQLRLNEGAGKISGTGVALVKAVVEAVKARNSVRQRLTRQFSIEKSAEQLDSELVRSALAEKDFQIPEADLSLLLNTLAL
jgi:Ca2+-binding EF-hand superfamily protein